MELQRFQTQFQIHPQTAKPEDPKQGGTAQRTLQSVAPITDQHRAHGRR